ncbi:MAG TPA: HAMP domain-containing sensor histidine kinase [Longimicrobiales bacterium]|nr:HAMP domain-containing sensor histidine kinase [Longimicrobiales bacterium]
MRPSIGKVRLQLTAWYIAVFAVLLMGFGTAIYGVVDRQLQAGVDRSLERTVNRRTKLLLAGRRVPLDIAQDTALYDGRVVYVFDSLAHPYASATPPADVQEFAQRVLRDSIARDTVPPTTDKRSWILYGKKFRTTRGNTYATVAAVDVVEIRDRYPSIVRGFLASAVITLLLIGLGSATLARKSTAPIVNAFEQMRRFMGDAAHELKTPVAVLRARADVALQRPRSPAEYEETLQNVSAEARRLGKLVENMLQLARADAGQWPITRERVFLDDVLLDAASAARALGSEKGVQGEVALLDESPTMGDPALLRQLFLILLDNAVQFTPAGGRITASVSNGRDCRVRIQDSGAGIPAAALPNVFDRFYRADPARGRAGAGLGLSIARWIVDVHHADIDIRSVEGKGTTVELVFPTG